MDENNTHERAPKATTTDAAPRGSDTPAAHGSRDARTPSYRQGNRTHESRPPYGQRNDAQGAQRNASGAKRNTFRRSFRKEKYDRIAAEKMVIDYKRPEILRRFLTDRGKILSRYVTGNSAKNQRRLVREVKRARFVGLLPSA